MSEDVWGLIAREHRAAMKDFQDELIVKMCFGEPGEYFDGEEYEKRAKLLTDPETFGPYLRGEIEA